MQPEIEIVCDGSSLGNGTNEMKAAAVALLKCAAHSKFVGRFLGSMTNQQAEIMAAIVALEALRKPSVIILRSDSKYLIETMCGRFKRKANHQLWEQLERAAAPHIISWLWTPGHSTDAEQILCDRTARQIAATPTGLDNLLHRATQAMTNLSA